MLLCRKSVKQFALDCSKTYRSGKFERVSKEFLDYIEGRLKFFVEDTVKHAPSIGKTIKAP